MRHGVFKEELLKAFTSFRFYGAVLCMTALLYICTASEINLIGIEGHIGTAYYFYLCVDDSNTLGNIMLVVVALPFAIDFCSDYKNRYFRHIISRTSVNSYICSKAIVCFIATFCAIALGCILYVASLCLFFPLANEYTSLIPEVYELAFPTEKYALLTLSFCILKRSFAAAFWGELALAATSFIPNGFTAFFSPLIFNALLNLVPGMLPDDISNYFNLIAILGNSVPFDTWQFDLFYSCGLFIVLAAVCSVIFIRQARRLITNA